MRASTLLARTTWCCANRGTSQNACALFASYTGYGFSGEYQGGTESTRPRSCKISKKSIFRAALCRVMNLFCARAVQQARTWATLSGALLHSLHVTSPVISVCVFWQAYNLVGIIVIVIIIIIFNAVNCFLHSPGTGANPCSWGTRGVFYLMYRNLLSMYAAPRRMIWLQGSFLNSGPFPL